MTQETQVADNRRMAVVGGSVTQAEKELVGLAATRAGYATVSEYVREVMLRHAEGVLSQRRVPDRRTA